MEFDSHAQSFLSLSTKARIIDSCVMCSQYKVKSPDSIITR